MTLDDIRFSLDLNLRVTPVGDDGILDPYRAGVNGLLRYIPTDANMIAIRDITVGASATVTLHMNDFHVDSETEAWKTPDNTDVAFGTRYAMLCYTQSTSLAVGESSLINVYETILGVSSRVGYLQATGNEQSDLWLNLTFQGRPTTSIHDFAFVEDTGDAASVVRSVCIGKDEVL